MVGPRKQSKATQNIKTIRTVIPELYSEKAKELIKLRLQMAALSYESFSRGGGGGGQVAVSIIVSYT